jgi:hypothetical protein
MGLAFWPIVESEVSDLPFFRAIAEEATRGSLLFV